MQCATTVTPDDIDLPALRARYLAERDKRLRPEGHAQYIETKDDLAGLYETDPHMPPVVRGPIFEDIDVAIFGAGLAGLMAGVRLKEAGVTNFRNIDMAGDFGGVWYWNRYPGVQCDVESYCYLPLLEETNYIPKERYSYGPEIYEHCQRIARHYGLYDGALFSTLIRSMKWDPAIKRWRIATNYGDDIRARFVIIASGTHHRPKLPGIPGIRSFKGHIFHTARWDYDYTGGDSTGGLVKLADKRVAIIGTGATALQVVPHLGRHAKHLYVLQRTPAYVDARGNAPTDPAWVKTLKPGWHAERQRAFHRGTFEYFTSPEQDVVCDGWSEITRNMAAKLVAQGRPNMTAQELADFREEEDYKAMERLRRRVESIVQDKDTAEKLKAYYRFMCKRPGFHDDYLPTFNRPNVTLIDVASTKGVERITEKGFVAGGVEHEIDCIVYSTGFEITPDYRRRLGIDAVDGRDGRSLFDHWTDGPQTMHGMTTHGFPNLFFIGYIQAATAANLTLMFDQQATHISYMAKEAIARGAATLEPTKDAQDDWVRTIREKRTANPKFWRECTPGYNNNEGSEEVRPYSGEGYGPGFYAFDDLLKAWRNKGDMEGLALGA
jgi:cyclohexanone monooxygenase